MSVRSFTVFLDSPAEIPKPDRSGEGLQSTLATDATASLLLSTLAAVEKENLHPLTGERAGPAACSESKKRKTAALSTKLVVVPSSKKKKEPKTESTKKQRKVLGTSGKSQTFGGKKTGSSKKHPSSRRTSPLPSVREELDAPREAVAFPSLQTNIDSRCYELTVSPLADVSEAYDPVSLDSHTDEEPPTEPIANSHLPELCEEMPKTNHSSPRHHSTTRERKHMSSEFTFSSPSPTSERFRKAQPSPTHHTDFDSQSD
ncbi:hypothetical protein EDD17DRAFT_1869274 [Pisolithus thermaeus]|nr:hypothetical protein EV401DRAFT_2091877 [Pisolithus croceorrhizus]KAI6168588.1 hypothetical protein EDD17DRAFT_1869274 [Pisolithus thermaeus]